MLGDSIKKIREDKKLTQSDVVLKAKELKRDNNKGTFTQSQLSKWEKNEVLPTNENIELLSQIYNCPVSLLVQEVDEYGAEAIYQEAFSLGSNFKSTELQMVIYNATETKRNHKDRIEYIMTFLMKNGLMIPKCFLKMLDICKDNPDSNELLLMYYSFIMGFWNGSFKKSNKV